MLFKDLKQGNSIYLFDRNDITVSVGQVTAVSVPHLDAAKKPLSMVIDVTVLNDGKPQTYTIADGNEVCYAGQLMLTPNRDCVMREIQDVKTLAENALNNIDKYKTTVSKCNSILIEFDPLFKEKKQNDERFDKLEKSIADIKELLSNLHKS